MSLVSNLSEPVSHGITIVSLGTLVGWIVGALPVFSLAVTALWGILKCIEALQNIRLNGRKLRE